MKQFNKYPNIFSPLKVGNMVLKNRIQFSPVVSGHAATVTGEVTEGLIEFIGAQARTGVSLVTIGASPVDYDRARDFFGSLSVVHDSDVPDLKLIVEEVHRYGAKLSIELTHAGRVADTVLLNGKPAFVPSVIPEIDKDRNVVEINEDEIDEVISHYLDAVRRCMEAGFDMVMIHMAHGNLLSSFLSPAFNKRIDRYGGSLNNRMRFPLELLKAVREMVNNKISIEIRICGNEYIKGSPTIIDVASFLKEAQGYLDLVNISGGMIITPYYAQYTIPSYYMPHMINMEYAAEIKKAVDIPVSVVGNITNIDEAEEILVSGKADLVAMARNLIADQDYVTKAYRGNSDEIRPCLRCLHCLHGPHIGSPLRCAVNPQAGREVKYAFLTKADERKKIMIIGGGPAGMMAAQIAVRRGHEVVLYEQSDKLGGRLYESSAMSNKDCFRKYTGWNIDTTMQGGARIMLNHKATPQTVEEENPDTLIIAIGAEHIVPSIEGFHLPNVFNISDVVLKKVTIGEQVIVCGGGLSGTECALDLAREGKKVVLIDMKTQEELCNDIFFLIRITMFELLEELDIVTYYESNISRITEKGVEIVDNSGNRNFLEADTVITALGLRRNEKVINELISVIPETYVVGDSNQIGSIASANRDAFNITIEI